MKILYAFQGTGNGHTSRAIEILPILQSMAEVDVLCSGGNLDLTLAVKVKYHYRGLGYIPGKNGGIALAKSFQKFKPLHFFKDALQVPVKNYDLVLNDFEPVTALACKWKNVPIIGLSHQAAFLSPNTPRPEKRDSFGEWILKTYAPAPRNLGFHFDRFDTFIETPVLRKAISQASPTHLGHITVYLPAYRDQVIIKHLTSIESQKFHVFSAHTRKPYTFMNVRVFPLDGTQFTESLVSSEGLICGAGFEAPSEAIHLGKKLMVIPMKGQYEQACNAAALKRMGVTVLDSIDTTFADRVINWLDERFFVHIQYPDKTRQILSRLIHD